MSAGHYALGVAGVVVIAVALGAGAVRGRAWILPGWSGAPARLAEVVLAVSGLFVLAELLGLVGLLKGGFLVGASVILGAVTFLIRPRGRSEPDSGPTPANVPPSPLPMTALAIALAFVVAMHWAVAAQVSLDYGLFNADDLQSHLPTAARFAQSGSIAHLVFATPSFLIWLYPDNSELFQAIGMTLFRGDVLAPLVNLGWMAITLLAAWCFGRRFGAAPQAMTAAALVLDLPLMVATQAGTTKNDTLVLAGLASAAAMLVNGARDSEVAGRGFLRGGGTVIEPGALAIAGLAAGLAMGTKFSLVVTATVLAACLVWIAPPSSRLRTALIFVLPALATGGIWYLRNLIDAGNPLPWVEHLGPITTPGLHQNLNQAPHLFSVAGRITDTDAWNDSFGPGFNDQLGPLWPVLLAVGLTGLAAGVIARGSAVRRAVAVAGLAALVMYLSLPLGSVDDAGNLVGFAYALRHLMPALLIGLLVSAVLLTSIGARAAWATMLGLGALVLFFTRRGLDFWDSTGYLAGALLIGLALIAVPIAFAALPRMGTGGRFAMAATALGLAAVLVTAGWPQARDYADARYRKPLPDSVYERFLVDRNVDPLLPVYRWAQDVHHARIGTSAVLQYGLYDNDLTNHVQYVGVRGPDAGFDIARTCESWRDAVNRGDYDYVVAAPRYGGTRVPQRAWTDVPGVTRIVFESGPATVFRINGKLDPATCK